MAHVVLLYAEGVSGNDCDLILLNSLCTESVHIAAVGECTPDEETTLRLCISDLLGEAVVDVAAHEVALLAVDVAELIEVSLAVNGGHKPV